MKKLFLVLIFLINILVNVLSNNIGIPIGLQNLGATCYMNSVLQCLYQVEPLTKFMLSDQAEDLYKPNTIASKYISLLKEIQKKPELIKENGMGKFCNLVFERFFEKSSGQQDAQEFLNQFIQSLENLDIKYSKLKYKQYNTEKIKSEETPDNEVASIFDFFIKSTVNYEYGGENYTRSTDELYSTLSLEIEKAEKNINSIKDALETFFFPEELKGEQSVQHQISVGNVILVDAFKTLSFSSIPDYLIIHLKRFKFNVFSQAIKINKSISFPIKNLDLSGYCDENLKKENNNKYDLLGVIQHSGSLSGGHYTSYVKNKGNWYYCNDSKITKKKLIDIKKIAKKGTDNSFTPYILFYEREKVKKPDFSQRITLLDLSRQLRDLNSSLLGLSKLKYK